MQSVVFDRLYNRLNKAQKEAVDATEGPVMVIAGPGTGKTSILTLRIANILKKTDTAPENILALTFTESGAYTMRKKLVEIIGVSAYKVNISTFHGFCNEIIKQYPERFPRIIGSASITEVDQIAIMEEIIQNTDLEFLKPYGDQIFYVKPALSEIRTLKREAESVSDFEEGIEKQEADFEKEPEKVHIKGAHKGKMKGEFLKLLEHIKKNRELLQLYTAYEQALVEKKYYDYEDMIVEVVKTLKKDPDLLLILQETYQYVLADEHQDANNAQSAVLELLSNFHKNPNLFVVGDEKQAIFRFQGASVENFDYFKKLYPKAAFINLEENYRSNQPILDASHSLILNNASSANVKLTAQKERQKEKELIQIHEFPNSDSEHHFIAKEIEKKIKEGTKAEEIAILYHNNNESFSIAYALEKPGIPFRIESDNNIWNEQEIRKLLLIFESINDLADEAALAKVLFIDFFKLEPLSVYKALQTARKEKKKLFEVAGMEFPEITAKLSSWSSLAHNKPFINVFEIIVRESGFLATALTSLDSFERLSTLEVFFEEVRRLAGARKEYYIADFIRHLHRVKEHEILSKYDQGNVSTAIKKGVRLMTAHRSKGLEFDYLYIIGAYDGHWGNKKKRNYFHIPMINSSSIGGIDDERRLFYVALTRARKGVSITYAKVGQEGQNGPREQLPSQFIGEIDEKLKETHIHTETVSIAHRLSASPESDGREINNKQYLQNLFLEQGLSPTALNNYIKCPWEYFFVNLIQIPKAQDKHQMYGTAVHETLRTFFDKYKIDEDMNKEDFLALFEFNLNKLPLSPSDFEETLKKGKKSLSAYYENYKNKWPRQLITEFNIKGIHLDSPVGTILLKGKLDKIELLNDREVNVVDYKTGRANPKNKDNYHRQLVFYKLLLDSDDKKKYVMKSGELDYIESDNKGRFKKEKFEITESEIKDLKELVKEKSGDIYELKFWGKTCDKKDCEFCELGKLMR